MKTPVPYSCAVITMSDKGSQGKRDDTSGEYLQKSLVDAGYDLQFYVIIPDNRQIIAETVQQVIDDKKISLVVTTGGTGVSPSDVTPEAMEDVLEKEIPGMAEAMRAASLLKTSRAMLSRGKVGIRGESLVINLPGSLKAVKENFEVVLPVIPHALEKIKGGEGDCGQVA